MLKHVIGKFTRAADMVSSFLELIKTREIEIERIRKECIEIMVQEVILLESRINGGSIESILVKLYSLH